MTREERIPLVTLPGLGLHADCCCGNNFKPANSLTGGVERFSKYCEVELPVEGKENK